MKTKLLILFLILYSSYSLPATIKGFVLDKVTLKPVALAFVIIDGQKMGTRTDTKGFFIIKKVSIGKHQVQASSRLGYLLFIDSINIQNENQVIELTIKLEPEVIYIDTVSEIENYHQFLNKYDPEDILEITLDSIVVDTSNPKHSKIFSTFINKTDTPVYVLRDIECLHMVKLEIKNSEDECFNMNSTFIDCTGMKNSPDSSDFIKINSLDSVKYPPVFLYFYDFSHYPSDKYQIKLIYTYKRPDTLPGFHDPKQLNKYLSNQIYYYNMALRGEFESTNSLTFNNYQIVK